jgi:hypothetical protein
MVYRLSVSVNKTRNNSARQKAAGAYLSEQKVLFV